MPVYLQDLQKGAKIESADGDIIEVIKVEAQRTTKLLELKRPGRQVLDADGVGKMIWNMIQ